MVREEQVMHSTAGRPRALVAILVAVGTLAAAGSAAAATATPPPAVGRDCVEYQVWAHGDAAAVAARLPDEYAPYMDGGEPLVFARAERCERLDAAGRSAPMTLADYGIVITSPDGYGCGSGLPPFGVENGNSPPICNWYTLGFISDDQRVVDFLRRGTPKLPVSLVPGLTYEIGQPDGGGVSTFRFASPGFTIDGTSSMRPGDIALRGAYYFPAVPQGTTKLLVSTDDLEGGHADTVVHAAPGSELAQLLGAAERPSVEPYNEFGVIRIGHGILRKQLLGGALPGERLASFDGSCAVKGDVTFAPPATNDQHPTRVGYDAKGTCSGKLDGKDIADVAVSLHQAGDVDASCMHAMTTSPMVGTIGVADGTQLPYTLDFTAKLTETDGNAYGTRSGIATVHASFANENASPDTPAQCGGDGLAKAPMDLRLETNSPLVSTTAVAPNASAERMMVPRFPGS
jgi:hypothetical protein